MSEQQDKRRESVPQEPQVQIVHQAPADINALRDFDVNQTLAVMEKRVQVMEQMRLIAIRACNDRDIVNMGGHPYIQASGKDKIARGLGVNSRIIRGPWKDYAKDGRGEFYIYYVHVHVWHPHLGEVDAVGTASQRDQFFAKAKGVWKEDTDIEETNIIRKAQTNAVNRGIEALLGLKNLTWEEIRKYHPGAGQHSATVEYGGNGKKSTSTQYKEPEGGPARGQSSRSAKDELWDLCLKEADGDPDKAGMLLEEATGFEGNNGWVPGFNDINHPKLSDKRAWASLQSYKRQLDGQGGGEQ